MLISISEQLRDSKKASLKLDKGEFISESFSFGIKSPMKVPNHSLEHVPFTLWFGNLIWRFEPPLTSLKVR